jgi:hypothetical protein
MFRRHQVLRLRLSVGVKQTALPLSSHFSNVVEAQSKFSFRVGRLFAIREDERVSSVRESFAQVRASPSLPSLSLQPKPNCLSLEAALWRQEDREMADN